MHKSFIRNKWSFFKRRFDTRWWDRESSAPQKRNLLLLQWLPLRVIWNRIMKRNLRHQQISNKLIAVCSTSFLFQCDDLDKSKLRWFSCISSMFMIDFLWNVSETECLIMPLLQLKIADFEVAHFIINKKIT